MENNDKDHCSFVISICVSNMLRPQRFLSREVETDSHSLDIKEEVGNHQTQRVKCLKPSISKKIKRARRVQLWVWGKKMGGKDEVSSNWEDCVHYLIDQLSLLNCMS